jgi:bifunctional non-homologous end joining protein LigD
MDLKRYRGEGGSGPRDNPRRTLESPGNRFVIQEHRATRFHYDFRLELVGEKEEVSILHSWMIPKNIPLEPDVRHLAIKVDNKHLDYLEKDNEVVNGEFGKGQVKMWDKGRWGLMKGSIASGQIAFNLFGEIVKARYIMQKQENNKEKQNHWMIWRASNY